MKSRLSLFVLTALALTFVRPAPALAKTKPESAEVEHKKTLTVVALKATPEAIHTAALQALAEIGCEIKKDSSTAIEGKRPNKVGLAVGSGGEKLFVEIKDLGEGNTELKVTTKKTMMGIIGQKPWNEELATQISNATQ